MDTSGIDIAISAAEALQHGLRHRSTELLDLEQHAIGVKRGRANPLVLIDWAGDVDRAVNVHAQDHVHEIETKLGTARKQLEWTVEDGAAIPERVNAAARSIGRASREVKMAFGSLNALSAALRPTAQGLASDPKIADTALEGLTAAVSEVEKAQRAAFRLTEDLPELKRQMDRAEESEVIGPTLDAPATTPVREQTLGLHAERRTPPSPHRSRGPAIAPEI